MPTTETLSNEKPRVVHEERSTAKIIALGISLVQIIIMAVFTLPAPIRAVYNGFMPPDDSPYKLAIRGVWKLVPWGGTALILAVPLFVALAITLVIYDELLPRFLDNVLNDFEAYEIAQAICGVVIVALVFAVTLGLLHSHATDLGNLVSDYLGFGKHGMDPYPNGKPSDYAAVYHGAIQPYINGLTS